MKIERHVFTRGADEGQTLRKGFDLARSLALQHKAGVTFCCEKKGFQTLVGAMIGQDLAKQLFREYTATSADGILVALYPREKWLERIDDMRHVRAVVFFAYQNDEAKAWAERWGAEKHGDLA